MLVTLSTKLTVEQRDAFFALAHALDTSPAGLARDIIGRFLETGESTPSPTEDLIVDTSDDVTRSLVLLRFIAEHIDAGEAQRLMDETDAFLSEQQEASPTFSDTLNCPAPSASQAGSEGRHG